jgi:hypothetical protein
VNMLLLHQAGAFLLKIVLFSSLRTGVFRTKDSLNCILVESRFSRRWCVALQYFIIPA